MGKLTLRGSVPPDDPMFSTGPEVFSPLGFRPSSTAPPNDATSVSLRPSISDNLSEEEEEIRVGKQMTIGRLVQNVQLSMSARGKPLGSVSAKRILEMADSGEMEDSPSVQMIRRLVGA